jgi:phage portal protein BeeE
MTAKPSFFERIFKRGNVQDAPWTKQVDTLSLFEDPFSTKSTAGVNVTPSTALTHSAVWAAVRLLSDTIASLPFQIVERTPTGRRLAGFHPLYP